MKKDLKKERLEWLKRKELAELELNKLTASVQKRYADYNHLCSYIDCKKPGAVSSSTAGSENWYCKDHIIL